MLDPTKFYPWQINIASKWLQNRNRFSHAWLIHGLPGIGKQQFALAAAASILCEQPSKELACGRCQSCHWIKHGNHPDIKRIRPDSHALSEYEEGYPVDDSTLGGAKSISNEIRVDQLRRLESWFNTATHKGGYRVAVLYPAQNLNIISANALLKILEEPPTSTLFFLVADAVDMLLPTIVSRCRRMPLPVPDTDVGIQWLKENNIKKPELWLSATSMAPVKALKLALEASQPYPDWLPKLLKLVVISDTNPDVSGLISEIEKDKGTICIEIIQRALIDTLLLKNGLPARYYPDLEVLHDLMNRVSSKSVSNTLKWIGKQKLIANHPVNYSLLLHSMLQRLILTLRS